MLYSFLTTWWGVTTDCNQVFLSIVFCFRSTEKSNLLWTLLPHWLLKITILPVTRTFRDEVGVWFLRHIVQSPGTVHVHALQGLFLRGSRQTQRGQVWQGSGRVALSQMCIPYQRNEGFQRFWYQLFLMSSLTRFWKIDIQMHCCLARKHAFGRKTAADDDEGASGGGYGSYIFGNSFESQYKFLVWSQLMKCIASLLLPYLGNFSFLSTWYTWGWVEFVGVPTKRSREGGLEFACTVWTCAKSLLILKKCRLNCIYITHLFKRFRHFESTDFSQILINKLSASFFRW